MEHVETMPLISKESVPGCRLRTMMSWNPGFRKKEVARCLGCSALDVGLTRTGWKETFAWMESVGLGRAFAEGAWIETEVSEVNDLPEFFNHPKKLLGL